MTSSESDESSTPESTADIDFESVAANASAARALEDLQAQAEASGAQDRPQPPIDLTAAAFFDVDNTLVQGSSALHFGRGLAARSYFTYRDVLGFFYAQAKFQVLGKENSDDVAAGRRKALAFIEGRSVEQLVDSTRLNGTGLVDPIEAADAAANLGRLMDTRQMANRRYGSDSTRSTKRAMTVSAIPPRKPAARPRVAPMTTVARVATTPTNKETRAP